MTDPDGLYVDGTLGGAGHAEAICRRLGPRGRLMGLDRDPQALERAAERLKPWKAQVELKHTEFGVMETILNSEAQSPCGILLDLGFSSDQMDTAERGFSFRNDGPLDMRMNPTDAHTAADLLNTWDLESLRTCFRDLGEERHAHRIARHIVERREEQPWATTGQLAEAIAHLPGMRTTSIHPATRVFQALRMAVNRELDQLNAALEQAFRLLRAGGRLAVISFHSLEDRQVKWRMKAHTRTWENLQEGGRRPLGEEPLGVCLTRKPIQPGEEEQKANPRSRSARLRLWERNGS